MSQFSVHFAPAAERDVSDAFAWYAARNKTAANGFLDEVLEAVEYIASNPNSKPENDSGDRKWILKRFPYSVIYALKGSVITVIAVDHHKRKPDYWRS